MTDVTLGYILVIVFLRQMYAKTTCKCRKNAVWAGEEAVRERGEGLRVEEGWA